MNTAGDLMSGFQAGSAIGGGLRQAFVQRPAMEEAMKAIQQGQDPMQVYQQLAATDPRSANELLKTINAQQTVQQNQMALQQDQQRQKTLDTARQSVGDDPIMQFMFDDPETAGLVVRYTGEIDARKRVGAALPLMGALSVTNPQAKRNLIKEAIGNFQAFSPALASGLRDINKLDDSKLDMAIKPVVQMLGSMGFLPKKPDGQEDKTAQQKNYEFYVDLLERGEKSKADRFAQAANLNPTERVKLAVQETIGKKTAGRVGEQTDKGLRSADNLSNITRAIDLLDQVRTGGYQSAKKSVTDFLGMTPADEAEFAYLTGKTVLGQLKDTFGAQFTNEEAKRLESLEAGLGRSSEANMRILNRARNSSIKAAMRGLRAAREQGDLFTYREISNALRAIGVDPENQVENVDMEKQPTQQPMQNKTADDYLNEVGG